MASRFTVRDVLAGQAPHGASVTVKGWVRTRRDSKAGFSFVNVSDGSSFHPVQVVAANALPNYSQEILKLDRKSTRLNSSHGYISYAVFCLKKKKPDMGQLHDISYTPGDTGRQVA